VVGVSGHNASLRVYDTSDLSEIQEVYGGHDGHIVRVAFSRDGRYLATAGVDNYIHLWEWRLRKKTKSYLVDGPVVHLGFPDSRNNLLAIVLLDDAWKLFCWSPTTDQMADDSAREKIHRLFHNSLPIQRSQVHLHACAVDCDRGYSVLGIFDKAASGLDKYRCGIWDGVRVTAEYKHQYFVRAVAHHPARGLAATGDSVGQVHIWSSKTGQQVAQFRPSTLGIFAIEYDGPTRLKFGRNPYQSERDWQLNHYAALTQYIDLAQQSIGTVPPVDGGHRGPNVPQRLGDLDVRLRPNNELTVERAGRRLSSIAFGRSKEFSPNAVGVLRGNDRGFTESVVVGFSNGTLAIHDPGTLQLKGSFFGHTGQVWGFSQSPDGRLMATASGDNTIRIWPLRPGRQMGNLPVFTDRDGTIYDLGARHSQPRAFCELATGF
jgi:WD40 repeat protein